MVRSAAKVDLIWPDDAGYPELALACLVASFALKPPHLP